MCDPRRDHDLVKYVAFYGSYKVKWKSNVIDALTCVLIFTVITDVSLRLDILRIQHVRYVAFGNYHAYCCWVQSMSPAKLYIRKSLGLHQSSTFEAWSIPPCVSSVFFLPDSRSGHVLKVVHRHKSWQAVDEFLPYLICRQLIYSILGKVEHNSSETGRRMFLSLTHV